MKRRALSVFISIILVASMLLSACSSSSGDDTKNQGEQVGDFLIEDNKDGTATIVGYEGEETDVQIPDVIDGKTVTEIGDAAFFNKTRIETVSIPETVFEIGSGAFANCASLKSFEMPGSVLALGEYVFARDESLSEVTLSENLAEIPVQTFYKCKALGEIVIPEGVTTIGEAAFKDCEVLTSITLPDSLKRVGDGAFSGLNYSEQELVIPVKTLTDGALSGMVAASVSFPNLESIENGGLRQLTVDVLHIPASVSYISEDALKELSTKEITVDEENRYYCAVDGVLYSKDKKTLIRYPKWMNPEDGVIPFEDGVTTIADYAFSGVNRMDLDYEIPFVCNIPETVTEIRINSFEGSGFDEVSVPGSVTVIPEGAFKSMSDLKVLTLEEGVTEIQSEALWGVVTVESIRIPTSVSKIDPTAFEGNQLKEIRVAEGNEKYLDVDGILYDKNGETLIVYPGALLSEDMTVRVPAETTTIGANAFSGNTLVVRIHVPDSVTTIEERAFYNTEALCALEIPSSVTRIGEEAIGYAGGTTAEGTLYAHQFYMVGEEESEARNYAKDNGIAFFTKDPSEISEEVMMTTGETLQLDQTGVIEGTAVYTSSDESVCYCDEEEQGYVTAISEGQATIIRAVGYAYKAFTITVTGEEVSDDHVTNVEKIGKEYEFDASEYTEITEDTLDGYLETVAENNKNVSTDVKDNYCINCYTTNEFMPLFAVQGDTVTADRIQNDPGYRNLELYSLISDELQKELAQYTNTEKVILYSGIPSAAAVTGSGNSVADMKASIGQVYEAETNVSTSLYHQVSAGFTGTGSGQAMLEIYADPELIVGSYISAISEFPDERELLLAEGSRFIVLDAGVRPYETEVMGEMNVAMERYFKLLLIQ